MRKLPKAPPWRLVAASAYLGVALCRPISAETGQTNIVNGVILDYGDTYRVGSNGP